MAYYLAIKKKEILPFATTWMQLEDLMLSEISQTRQTPCDFTCEIKKQTNEQTSKTKQKQTHTNRAQIDGFQGNR